MTLYVRIRNLIRTIDRSATLPRTENPPKRESPEREFQNREFQDREFQDREFQDRESQDRESQDRESPRGRREGDICLKKYRTFVLKF